jgi:hypothetical protein
MSKKGTANGSFFGNFLYEQILDRRPHFLKDLASLAACNSSCPSSCLSSIWSSPHGMCLSCCFIHFAASKSKIGPDCHEIYYHGDEVPENHRP